MAKRNRVQELKRHGELQGVSQAHEQAKAVVTDADRRWLGGITLWSHAYVNYVYAHCGHRGEPQPKELTESLLWEHVRSGGSRLEHPLRVRANAISVPLPVDISSDARNEYYRQLRLGVHLYVSRRTLHGQVEIDESLDLDIDADGAIVGGSYRWQGDEAVERRQAPNAGFSSLDSAHEATVSGCAAYLLGHFRELVLQPPVDMRIQGMHGRDLPVAPPPELIPIPNFQ